MLHYCAALNSSSNIKSCILSVFCFPLFALCSVLAVIVNNEHFTITINHCQTRNKVEIVKICCFSLVTHSIYSTKY